MNTKLFASSFPYEIRKAIADCNWIKGVVERDAALKADHSGFLLSVKESNRREREEGDSSETTVTCRYENGLVVRLVLIGHQDSHFGFLWQSKVATVRCFQQGANGGPGDDEGKIEFSFHLSHRLEETLPQLIKRLGLAWSKKAGVRNSRIFAGSEKNMREEGLDEKTIQILLNRARRALRHYDGVGNCAHYYTGDAMKSTNNSGAGLVSGLAWLSDFASEDEAKV